MEPCGSFIFKGINLIMIEPLLLRALWCMQDKISCILSEFYCSCDIINGEHQVAFCGLATFWNVVCLVTFLVANIKYLTPKVKSGKVYLIQSL